MTKQTNNSTTPELPLAGKFGTLQIKRWMLFELNLQGLQLLLFALIYQTRLKLKPEGWTVSELATWFSRQPNNIRRELNTLIDKGLLRHDEPDTNAPKKELHYLFQHPKRVRTAPVWTDEQRREFYRIHIPEVLAASPNPIKPPTDKKN